MEVKNSNNKVVVGFKCSPELQSKLLQRAENLGITLSSFIEAEIQSTENLKNEMLHIKEENKRLNRINLFYEQNQLLQNLYEKHKGTTVSYKESSSGKHLQREVKSIQDIFIIISSSFRING